MKIALPPSINRTYKTTRSGGFYKAVEAKQWQELAGWSIKKQWLSKMIEGPCYVGLTYYYSGREPDIDFGNKIIHDTMQGIVYENDRQIVHANQRKYKVEKGQERVEIVVAPTEL